MTLIVANWKMHLTKDKALALAKGVDEVTVPSGAEVVLCPPSIWLDVVASNVSNVKVGAQDMSEKEQGAFTGDISGSMIKSAGAAYVLLGHSERRQYHEEDDSLVADKVQAALEQKLTPIVCVGETAAERNADIALSVIRAQMEELKDIPDLIVAYEPVWAIGTGEVPTTEDIKKIHQHIKKINSSAKVLYGGSVKASNINEILNTEDVDGVLVGGASLQLAQFKTIIEAAAK